MGRVEVVVVVELLPAHELLQGGRLSELVDGELALDQLGVGVPPLRLHAVDPERGDLAAALAEQQGKLRGWAHQGVMREIIVGDVDKRIASFLQAQQAGDPAYLDLFVVDAGGRTIASSDPRLIGVSPPPAGGWRESFISC